jgi:hypothetical protein
MNPGRSEAGFSLIKMLLVLAVLAGGAWTGYLVFPLYNTYWKVQDAFKSATRNLTNLPESEIRGRLPDLLHVVYVEPSDLPQEFYDHLDIKAGDGRVEISSSYHVSVWLLGRPATMEQDEDHTASTIDKLRAKGRLEFYFHPYAKTP